MNDPQPAARPSPVSRRQLLSDAGAVAVGVGLTAALAPADAAAAPDSAPATRPATGPVEPARLPLKILTRSGIGETFAEHIRAFSPQVTLAIVHDREQYRAELPSADGVFGSPGRDDRAAATKLRWIQTGSAGVDSLLTPDLVASDVVVTCAKGCYGPEIAEHVFALLLGLTRGVVAQVRLAGQPNGKRWASAPGKPVELRGMTMGIIGLGGIGRETARRAKAMDMKVIAVDAEPMYDEHYAVADEIRLVDDGLDDLLERSDVIVVAAPLTRRTEGMLGKSQFERTKRGAYFVNVSRGKLVETDALIAALRDGRLAGAGLDVTHPEPLPDEHPLWELANVVITPHTAGRSQLVYDRVQAVLAENVGRYVAGLPLLNQVDKQKGY